MESFENKLKTSIKITLLKAYFNESDKHRIPQNKI
jgi:hypothetical protein